MFFYFKKVIGMLLLCSLFMGTIPARTVQAEDAQPDLLTQEAVTATTEAEPSLSLYATAAVLMDGDTGRVLYEKNGEQFLANASTTKIMTCILALEYGNLSDTVEVSKRAAGMPKVKLHMKEGEHFLLEDLLYSMMLESHNDSAMAIAEHVGGSMEGFAGMMNRKAEEIGCENTLFLTPNGLDAQKTVPEEDGDSKISNHGTTAEDLAKIMAYCAFHSPKAEEFLKITRTSAYTFQSMEGRSFSCVNHNAFLSMMEGALTGKTGFTNKAGYCYVGALERDGRRFTIALLACGWPNHKTYKWSDARTLFSYGLENYSYHSLTEASYEKDLLDPIPVKDAQTAYPGEEFLVPVKIKPGSIQKGEERHDGVDFVAFKENKKESIGILLKDGEKIETRSRVVPNLTAPVQKGTVVGEIVYLAGDTLLYREEIVTAETVERIDFFWCLTKVCRIFLPG